MAAQAQPVEAGTFSINMMKMTKSTHKISRNTRGSPIRKDHLMKKTMHPSASMRVSSTSSRPMMKRLSPGMKRGPVMPPSKSVHSSRVRPMASPPHRSVTRHSMQQSPVSMDRGLKRLKYDKRKMSPSPSRHPMPSSSVAIRGPSPYHSDRYLSVRPVVAHPPHYPSPPPKKKTRREADKFDHGAPSMMMLRPEIPPHSEGRMVQRSDMPTSRSGTVSSMSHPLLHRGHMTSSNHGERTPHFDAHGRGRGGPSSIPSHSKRPPPTTKPAYDTLRNERYQSPPTSNRYPTSDSEKNYAPTLHERFSSVVESNRTEPRIKYSREDLEKITIDIHRNLKAESPTVRRIVNPDDVKLVRRANEGHRPMFDREEIKQAPRDMRDEAHHEKNVVKGGGGYGSGHSMGLRDVENYEITRHRFDPHRQAFHASSGRSLSDRWQNADGRKDGALLDRDHRESEYERQPMKRNFNDSRTSKAGDRDFRSERYSGPSTSQGRPEYSPNHHMLPPSEPRNNSSMHRKATAPMDARRKLTVRRGSDRGPPPSIRPDSKSRYGAVEKRYPDSMSTRIEKPIERRSPIMEPPSWKTKSRSDSREKVTSFSRRPDKYSYKSLSEKSDGLSKSSNYYEDNRESSDSYRGRGSSRPFRSSRGARSRGIRGSPRGSFPSRSSFRGGYRGRGAPRRGRISPGVWEHDMYMRTPDDHKLSYP